MSEGEYKALIYSTRSLPEELVQKINLFSRQLELALDSKDSSVSIRESSGVMSGYDITIENESHTLGFLLQTYINKLNDERR